MSQGEYASNLGVLQVVPYVQEASMSTHLISECDIEDPLSRSGLPWYVATLDRQCVFLALLHLPGGGFHSSGYR
jgi:hypothetical protein